MSFLEVFEPGLKHLREETGRQKMVVVRPSPGGGATLRPDPRGVCLLSPENGRKDAHNLSDELRRATADGMPSATVRRRGRTCC
jgi:hypothetical protein